MIVSLTGKPFVFFFRRGKGTRDAISKAGGEEGGGGGGGVDWESGLGLGSR